MNYKLPHFAIWLLLWKIFVFIGFGSLWVIFTLFSAMFLNLGERKPGELSAYSVFNDGFTKILGTTSPEQFENEIRHNVLDGEDLDANNDDVDSLDGEGDDGLQGRNHHGQLRNNINGRGGRRRRDRP